MESYGYVHWPRKTLRALVESRARLKKHSAKLEFSKKAAWQKNKIKKTSTLLRNSPLKDLKR